MLRAMGASVVAMVLMLVIGPPFIRWLRLNEFGQNIREEGPEGHKTKEGTPPMVGVPSLVLCPSGPSSRMF